MPAKAEGQNNNMVKVIIGIVAAAAVVFFAMIALVVVMVSNSKKINLNDYITITAEGYDGFGTVSYEFDSQKFLDKYGDSIKLKKKADSADKLVVALYSSPAKALIGEMVHGQFDKKSELSNGDTVVFSWDCDDEKVKELFGYKLKYKDITYKVNDLEEVSTFDPFEGVSLDYYGISPMGNASVVVDSADSRVNSINFVLDKSYDLKNGDVVKVSMSEAMSQVQPTYYIERYGAMPLVTEKEFVVEGLGFYVSKEEDIPSELHDKMKSQAEDVIKAQVAQNWSQEATLNTLEYVGNYFLTAKEGSSYNTQNIVYYVFKLNASIVSSERKIDDNFTYYTYVRFENVLQMGDGTGSVSLADGRLCSETFRKEYPGGWFGYNYTIRGYEDLDTMFNQCVTTQIDKYAYTNSVTITN